MNEIEKLILCVVCVCVCEIGASPQLLVGRVGVMATLYYFLSQCFSFSFPPVLGLYVGVARTRAYSLLIDFLLCAQHTHTHIHCVLKIDLQTKKKYFVCVTHTDKLHI